MRSTMAAIPLLAACTSGDDSTTQYCNEACGDYYTVRALDSIHTKVWASALEETAPNKQGVAKFDAVAVPCIAGSLTTSGTATAEANGSVTIDLTVVHAGCEQSDPKDANGYAITTTGTVMWAGNFSTNGGRNLSYLVERAQHLGDRRRAGGADDHRRDVHAPRSRSPRNRRRSSPSPAPGVRATSSTI